MRHKTGKNPPNCYRVGDSWMIDFTYRGQRYRENIGPVSRTVARETAARRKAAVAEGRLKPDQRTEDPFFANACQRYLTWYQANREPNSYQRHLYSSKHLLAAFGTRRLSAITAFSIEKYKVRRKKAKARPATVNRELSMLGNLFTMAVKWKLADSNPAAGVAHFKEDARQRYLTEEEARRVLAACSPQLRLLVLAAMHTGFRTSELRSLTWSAVDFRNGSLTVLSAYSKNDETRSVPMTPDLESALRTVYDERRPGAGDPVFLNRDGQPWKSWRTAFRNAVKAAGLAGFRFHDLRHCFGSYLGMNNTNPKAMMELMGHRRPEMTMRYTHLSVEYKRQMVAKLPAFGTESPQNPPSAEEPKVVNFGK